jgi:hypothetical protein
MRTVSLTIPDGSATVAGMKRMIALGCAAAATGCVNVTAPNKPIEINLNISVTAETVVKLDTQAKTLIQQNPGIF